MRSIQGLVGTPQHSNMKWFVATKQYMRGLAGVGNLMIDDMIIVHLVWACRGTERRYVKRGECVKHGCQSIG
jgi:hypothetical protein